MELQEIDTATSVTQVQQDDRPWLIFPEKGIIVIRAKNTKTQLPLKCRPCEDATGKIFTGQGPTGHYETISEELRQSLSYLITPDSEIVLSDGKTVDLDRDPIDRANWIWLRKHPYLTLDKKSCLASRDARFYIEDPVQEAERRVISARSKDKARYIIQYDSSRDTLVKSASLLGNLGADSMTTGVLQDYLLQQADVIPDMVLEAIAPSNIERTNVKLMYVDLFKRRLIQRGNAGQFRFGGENGIPLGHTEDLVVDFMLDSKNAEAVTMMESALIQSKHIN